MPMARPCSWQKGMSSTPLHDTGASVVVVVEVEVVVEVVVEVDVEVVVEIEVEVDVEVIVDVEWLHVWHIAGQLF